ncbi:MAG: hypothetical protein IT480_10700 [Gammaproteobacteria bacterium]|nr:hypothetical protein [Gammaproteobacteria bacterium]
MRIPILRRPPRIGGYFRPVTDIDAAVRALFANNEQGGIWDPSYLPGLYQLHNGMPVTASGQPVGLILDGRFGYARGPNFAPDLSTVVAINGTTTSVTFSNGVLTATCIQNGVMGIRFNVAYLATRHEIKLDVVSSTLPGLSYDVAGQSGQFYGVTGDVVALPLPSSPGTTVNVYRFGAVVGDSFSIRHCEIRALAGNHLYQATSSARPLYTEAAGLRYLASDGIDDWIAAAFAIAQPIDRISGVEQVTWAQPNVIFGSADASDAGILFQTNGASNIYINSGASLGPHPWATGARGVITERHNGASSRLALGNAAYATGNASTTNPTGFSVGARGTGLHPSSINWYGTIMRGGPTPMTDAQIAACRLWCASRAGVTL